MPTLPTGTVTFLFTDIEGSAARWERDRAAMARALERHNAILERAIASRSGHVFHTAGDAYCAAFANAGSAVDAAIDAQRALSLERWDDVAPGFEPLRVRMAVHTGLVELTDGDYFGRPVNRVARLMSAAHGGQVLVSLATQQLVRDALPDGVQLVDLGVHRLRDLEHSEHICRLVAPGMPDVDTPPDTAERLGDGERAPPADLVPDAVCPYRGLHAFREQDARFFFGREAFTELLVEAVDAAPMVGVIGPSGSGKSSVVAAGLVPTLRARYDDVTWAVDMLRPGAEPFRALAALLVARLEPGLSETDRLLEIEKLACALREGQLSVPKVLSRIAEKDSSVRRWLLVADQFEELYTLTADDDDQRAFQDLLFEAAFEADGGLPLTLALTLRADFMGHALAYRPFADAMQKHDVKLGPMNREELARAIARPAEVQGRAFESGLVERIVDDVGEKAGSLPLLEFCLTKLWEGQDGGWLTHEAYEAIGRVEGAVARHADAVYEGLGPDEREQARRVFVQLVQPGEGTEDTRRLATRDELAEDWDLVSDLADARLVTTGRDEAGRQTAEVVHEALIRTWGRLTGWMNEDRRFRTWQERLRFALRQWVAAGRDEGALLRGVPLAEAEEWLAERRTELTDGERAYVEAGVALREVRVAEARAQAKRERRLEAQGKRLLRVVAGVSVVAAVVGMGLAALAWQAGRAAERQAEVARSLRLATTAAALFDEGDVGRSLALALEAVSIEAPPDPSVQTLARVAFAPGAVRSMGPLPSGVMDFALSPDGQRIYVPPSGFYQTEPQSDHVVRIYSTTTGRLLGELEDTQTRITGIDVSPDGRRVVGSSMFAGEVVLWNAETAKLEARWDSVAPKSTKVRFLANGARIIAGTALIDVGSGQLTGRILPALTINWFSTYDAAARLLAIDTGRMQTVLSIDAQRELWTVDRNLTRAAFTPDGERLVSETEGIVEVRNARSGELLHSFPSGLSSTSMTAAVGPSGRNFVVGMANGKIEVIDLTSQRHRLSLQAHDDAVLNVEFGADDGLLYSSGKDGMVHLWDLQRGDTLSRLQGPDGGAALGWTQDMQAVIAVETHGERESITVFDVQPPVDGRGASKLVERERFEGPTGVVPWDAVDLSRSSTGVRDYSISANGRYLALSPNDPRSLTVYDLQRFRQVWRVEAAHGGGFVEDMRMRPGDSAIVSVGWDNQMRVRDVADGEPRLAVRFEEPLAGLAISTDGQWAVTRLVYSEVLVRVDLATGEIIDRLDERKAGPVLAVSADGRWILSGSENGALALWEVATGRSLRAWRGHSGAIDQVAFSPQSDLALSASQDGTVRLWNLRDGSERYRIPGAPDALFRADGNAVFSRAAPGDFVIETDIEAEADAIVAWAADHRQARRLNCDERRQLQLQATCNEAAAPTSRPPDRREGNRQASPSVERPTQGPAFATATTIPATPAGERAARLGMQRSVLQPGSADVWTVDLREGEGLIAVMEAETVATEDRGGIADPTPTSSLDPQLVLRGPNGEPLVRAEDWDGERDRTAELVLDPVPVDGRYRIEARSRADPGHGRYRLGLNIARWLRPTGAIFGTSVALSLDDDLIASGSNYGTIAVHERRRRREISRFEALPAGYSVTALSFDPTGSRLAAGTRFGKVIIRDVRSDETIRELTTDYSVRAARFSPDGRRLYAGGDSGHITVWESGSGTEIVEWSAHEDRITDIALSPNGRRLLTASRDGSVRVWDTDNIVAIWQARPYAPGRVSVAVGPQGRLAVSGGQPASVQEAGLLIWDMDSGTSVALKGSFGDVRDVAISGNGDWVVSASEDRRLRLWSLPSQRLAYTLPAHGATGVARLAIGHGQPYLATVGGDGWLKMWDLADLMTDRDRE